MMSLDVGHEQLVLRVKTHVDSGIVQLLRRV